MIFGVGFAPAESTRPGPTMNTLRHYGLMLCDDLKIGAASPNFKFVKVPEMSGALDLTESLTGEVAYSQRSISFTLFAVHDVIAETNSPATEPHFEEVRQQLAEEIHGKRMKIWFPDDWYHYFVGRVSIGNRSGYNSGKIPVTVTAEPYRYGENGEKVL